MITKFFCLDYIYIICGFNKTVRHVIGKTIQLLDEIFSSCFRSCFGEKLFFRLCDILNNKTIYRCGNKKLKNKTRMRLSSYEWDDFIGFT